MLKDFIVFLKEYNITSLAIAFAMGTATTGLVTSLVQDILMPLLSPLFLNESWKTAVLHLGPVVLNLGAFLGQLLNFLLIALVVFIVAKKVLKIEKK